MKIALIDTGISKSEIRNRCNVRHFSLFNETLIEKYDEPRNDHGTHCFNEIVTTAKNTEIQIMDFNILDKSGNLQVSHIISAIQKSIEEQVDIINISLGLTVYSQELYDICEKATQNNIVVLSAASHANTISFPADFKNVICVKVDQNQTEKIKAIDHTTVSVSMRDFIISKDGTDFDFSSSSLASARLCGYFCDELDNMPLNDKFKILSRKYNIKFFNSNDVKSDNHLEESDIQHILYNNRIAIVLFPQNLLKNINTEFKYENIIAYYDFEKGSFFSFSNGNPTEDFDTIIIINSLYSDLEIPLAIKERYKRFQIVCIGNFINANENEYLYDYGRYESSELSILERPIIAITSLCSGLNKSDVQLSLFDSFKQDGLNVELITNNPVGLLFNASVFNFPKQLDFPNIVYSINRFMYVSEINKDIDAWLINIGGAVDQVNTMNTYNFGKLADAYFYAANIDIAIICVGPFTNFSHLRLQLAHMYKHGIEKIFIVLSHYDINASTVDFKDGLQTYYVDDSKYLAAFNNLKTNIEEKVFTLTDVENGVLYKNIIEVLS